MTAMAAEMSAMPLSQDALRTYRRLLGYIGPHKGMFLVGVLGMMLFASTNAAWALFTKEFLDGTFLERDPRMIWFVPLALVGIFIVRGAGDFMQTYFPGYVGRRIVKRLRGQIFDHFLRLPVAFFDRNAAGTLLSRLTYNTEQVAQATTDSITIFVRETLTIALLLTYLLYLDAYLTAIALVTGPVIAWLITLINRLFRRYSRRIQNSMGDVTRVAKEALEAPRVIKVFNAQRHEAAQFELANEANRRAFMKLLLTKGLSNPIVQALAAGGLSVVLYVATVQAVEGQLTVGEFTSFIVALIGITQPLRSLVNVAGPLQQGIAAGQDIFALLDEQPEPAGGSYTVARARGEVRFEQVHFAYAGDKGTVLSGVSFAVAAGETVAIVGRSGSGKSTLVNLLPRFYDVDRGAVSVDGRDVREFELANLREQVALVSQDIVLFNDTIRANIAFGREADDAQIEQAARAAHVLEFVRELPQGLDTAVGDRGVLLSGGQRQRIAIARALLKNAPILILDEATSALDTESERIIQAALDELMQNRTTLVIAHRLSTVEKADRIVVLDGGALVESGTHAELLALEGVYAQLYRLQFEV
jgi:subfamily B ATP-binding cassette protein MsbA